MAKAKQLKSGNWNVVVFDYTDAKGNRHYKSITEPTKELAEMKALSFKQSKKGKMKKVDAKTRELYLQSLLGEKEKNNVPEYNIILGKDKIKRTLKRLSSKEIQKELAEIDAMDGLSFEKHCQNLLALSGYFSGGTINKTVDSGDSGADVVVQTFTGERIVFQCKRFQSSVGIDAVQEAFSSMNHYFATKSAVITNNFFTPAAIALAKENNVVLLDRNSLIKLISLKNENLKKMENQWNAFLSAISKDENESVISE